MTSAPFPIPFPIPTLEGCWVVFYHDGIGTRGPLDRFTGGAFGAVAWCAIFARYT